MLLRADLCVSASLRRNPVTDETDSQGAPAGQLFLVGDIPRQQEPVLRRLLQRRKVPALLELVRGLMVMLFVELVRQSVAISRGLSGELAAHADAERGDARVRE